MRRRCAIAIISILLVAAACTDDGGTSSSASDVTVAAPTTTAVLRGEVVTVPLVTGPIEGGDRGGIPANPAPPEILADAGYVEEEFFISGEATAYAPVGLLGEDGMWEVQPATTAPYTTRILVRRPADPADASGVVGVEWFNVSAGQDADPDFGFLHPEMLEAGDTWVGVSAQFAGVDGPGLGIAIEGVTATPLKTADPTRYGPIVHPGDAYSYDIYSQAAQAIRRTNGVDPLGGGPAGDVVALGESQSAGRLATYINAVHPLADIYDGFFVHSRSGGAAALSTGAELPPVVRYRTDLTDPILAFQTETDVIRAFPSRQLDTDVLVTWEVAGAAHADQSQLDYGGASGRVLDPDRALPDFETMCGGTLNRGPQPVVSQRAWSDLTRWVVDGTPPATATQLQVVDGVMVRDELGIAVGGIRTPDVDVPIEVHSGQPRPGSSIICSLFGSSTPIDPSLLATRYPTQQDYVDQVRSSAEAAFDAGFLLRSGVDQVVAEAEVTPATG